MTISHHPSEDMLAHFAAGTLSEAEHLVIAVHVGGCVRCQRFVGRMEMLGAAGLADAEAPPEPPGAFAAIMAQVDRSPRPAPQATLSDPELAELPELLRRCQVGQWRWVAPGLTTLDAESERKLATILSRATRDKGVREVYTLPP